MNKYDALIHEFIVQQHEVSIEKIGVFHLVQAGESIPAADGEEGNMPEGSTVFLFDRKAETSPELISFMAERLQKSRLLVESDLSSHLEQVRQFINLGKPYQLSTLGWVSINNQSRYIFSPGSPEEAFNQPVFHYDQDGDGNMDARARGRNRLTGLAILIVLVIVGGIGYWIYSMVSGKQTAVAVAPDSLTHPAPAPDTAKLPVTTQAADTGLVASTLREADSAGQAGDSAVYRFLFEETMNPGRAHSRIANLRAGGDPARYDSVRLGDTSFRYRLFMRVKLPASDTARMRDSLVRYFNKPVRILK